MKTTKELTAEITKLKKENLSLKEKLEKARNRGSNVCALAQKVVKLYNEKSPYAYNALCDLERITEDFKIKSHEDQYN